MNWMPKSNENLGRKFGRNRPITRGIFRQYKPQKGYNEIEIDNSYSYQRQPGTLDQDEWFNSIMNSY